MNLDAALETLSRQPEAPLDLAELALRLAQDEYPDLDVEASLGELQAVARDASRFMGKSGVARVEGLCRYLFHELGFRGNAKHYYDPRNSYFNEVLDRRLGIPISLSMVVMAVGQRVGAPFVGIGLPGHFIIKSADSGILVDPYHGGRIISRDDCESLVYQMTGKSIPLPPSVLDPVPLGLILQRMLNNLRSIYLQEDDVARAQRVLLRLRQLSPDNVHHRRDLGLCQVRLGQPGKAIDHLRSYLYVAEEAEDFDDVQDVLRQAEKDVARWN